MRRRLLAPLTMERLPHGPASPPQVRQYPFARTPFLPYPPARTFDPRNGTLTLLNITRRHAVPVNWCRKDVPTLWELESNYFHWISPDMGYGKAKPFFMDWIANQPDDVRSQSWNPYAVAQRILQWTRLLDGWRTEWRDDPDSEAILKSLYRQARFLARRQEFEFLGNHLIKTATGLLAAGCFFSGKEPDEWKKTAMAILLGQFRRQILPDGGHYERSPMYHLLVLLDLADTLNMHQTDYAWSRQMTDFGARMVSFAADCRDTNGNLPLFNDSVYGQAPEIDDVISYACSVLNLAVPARGNSSTAFPHFGLFRLVNAPWEVWVDGGRISPDFLPAHAHADTASIQAWFDGHPLLVDSGVHCYGNDPVRRSYDRNGEAHNVLLLDGHSSSRCWKEFRVARRPSMTVSDYRPERLSTEITHDGFRFLPGAPLHTRVVSVKDVLMTVADSLCFSNTRRHVAHVIWHFDPSVRILEHRQTADTWRAILTDGARKLAISISPVDHVVIQDAPISRRFYVDEFSCTVRAQTSCADNTVVTTEFAPAPN